MYIYYRPRIPQRADWRLDTPHNLRFDTVEQQWGNKRQASSLSAFVHQNHDTESLQPSRSVLLLWHVEYHHLNMINISSTKHSTKYKIQTKTPTGWNMTEGKAAPNCVSPGRIAAWFEGLAQK